MEGAKSLDSDGIHKPFETKAWDMTLCHFPHILFIQASHKFNPESEWGENYKATGQMA